MLMVLKNYLKDSKNIIEIGSNDGTFLKTLKVISQIY